MYETDDYLMPYIPARCEICHENGMECSNMVCTLGESELYELDDYEALLEKYGIEV
jgi:hypothetical protein